MQPRERDDHFFLGFTESVKYSYYKDCYAEYTSKQKISWYFKKQILGKS